MGETGIGYGWCDSSARWMLAATSVPVCAAKILRFRSESRTISHSFGLDRHHWPVPQETRKWNHRAGSANGGATLDRFPSADELCVGIPRDERGIRHQTSPASSGRTRPRSREISFWSLGARGTEMSLIMRRQWRFRHFNFGFTESSWHCL